MLLFVLKLILRILLFLNGVFWLIFILFNLLTIGYDSNNTTLLELLSRGSFLLIVFLDIVSFVLLFAI